MSYPIAYPLAPTNRGLTYLQNAVFASNSGDDSMAFASNEVKAPHRAGRAVVARHRKRLSERDLEVIASVGRYKYLSARQVEELHFAGHATHLTGARTCRRVLERLADMGALWRLERRVGGVWAGSVSYVYTLAPLGRRVLADGQDGRVRRHEPSEGFLEHTLAVAQLAVDLHVLARDNADIDIVAMEPEPGCWRRFTAGLEGVSTLKPDLWISLRVGEFDYHWFVEIDRSTHSTAAVVHKCRIYHRYWQTGIEQDRTGLFPRVLYVAPGQRRASLIERSIRKARHLNQDLFAVTVADGALKWLTGEAS